MLVMILMFKSLTKMAKQRQFFSMFTNISKDEYNVRTIHQFEVLNANLEMERKHEIIVPSKWPIGHP
jgi:hypothetical protein